MVANVTRGKDKHEERARFKETRDQTLPPLLLSLVSCLLSLVSYLFDMAAPTNPVRARELLEEQIHRISRLRGGGPNPFDYTLWDARTEELISHIYGPGSSELARYHDAAGIRGRLPGVRGQAENMTLNIHGQWGILGRLDRAEIVLRDLVAGLHAAS